MFITHALPRFLVAGVILILGFRADAVSHTTEKTVAPEQREKLERDRLAKESSALEKEGKLAEAAVVMEKMLAIERSLLGETHEDVVMTLTRLAGLQERQDEFAAAHRRRQEVLTLQKERFGEKHWQVTDARLDLAHLDVLTQWSAEQRKRFREAQTISQEGWGFYRKSQFSKVLPFWVKSLEMHKKLLGEAHLFTAQATNNVGVLYLRMGELKQAEPLLIRSLEMHKQVLGETHPGVAHSLNRLATLYRDWGEYGRAEPMYRQSCEMLKQTLGENHFKLAEGLNALGGLYHKMANYPRAESSYRQAWAIAKKAKGEADPAQFPMLQNLASLYSDMGDFTGAEPLYRQSLELFKKGYGEMHPTYAQVLNNLAVLYLNRQDFLQAEKTLLRAEEILRACRLFLPSDHVGHLISLNNRANLYLAKGTPELAEPIFQELHEWVGKKMGDKNTIFAYTTHHLALTHSAMGDPARGEPLMRKALELRGNILGKSHPEYASSLKGLGELLHAQGKPEAESTLMQALQITMANLELAADGQSERQQLAMAVQLRKYLDHYLSLASHNRETGDQVYSYLLAWKGAVFLRQRQSRDRDRERGHDPELSKLFAELESTARRLAALAFSHPEPNAQQNWKEKVTDLTQQRDALERKLAQHSSSFRAQREANRVTPASLQKALPPATALLDFLEYIHLSPDAKIKGKFQKESRILVFILRSEGSLIRVDLGSTKAISEAVVNWRLQVKRAIPSKDDPGQELRRQVWLPLAEHLQGIKTALIAPDGVLTGLPFTALPGAKQGSYLLEEMALTVVPVPRMIPELLRKSNQGVRRIESSLLLVGDVDFDATPGQGHGQGRVAAHGQRSGARKLWKRLEGTRGEILAIHDSFEQRFVDGKVKVLRGDQSTKARLCNMAGTYSSLHLATHGFFAPPEVRSALTSDARDRRVSELFGDQGIAGFHPGLLSGLVLSGANHSVEPDQDNGILTALEVAELDLSKVELAVLSACETGLGKVAAGEGILGLQRAFQVAGAKSVVASLWSVDDESTRKLMERFYDNHWQKKMSRADALRQAQLAMLRGELVRGVVREDEDPAHRRLAPYYWAAFVLSGDWR